MNYFTAQSELKNPPSVSLIPALAEVAVIGLVLTVLVWIG